jgi:hypothetical protein
LYAPIVGSAATPRKLTRLAAARRTAADAPCSSRVS